MNEELYLSVGGKPMVEVSSKTKSFLSQPYWDFGWLPESRRTEEQLQAHDEAVKAMPKFEITGGKGRGDEKKVDLTGLWKHEMVVKALGHPYTGTHQLTGSCVGAGGGNVAASLAYVEVIRLGDPEKCILPFYLYTYGRSRHHCGMSGRGDGSTGTGWATAAKQDGILDNLSHPELPKPTNSDGLIWGAAKEKEWSAGNQSPCKDWLDKGKVHLIKTVAKCQNAGDVRTALLNYYPVTEASMYGHNPKVIDGVLMGIKGPRWSHQMSFHAFWEHPKHGPIYWLHNQWGLNAHGQCPTGMPGGGVWVKEADVEYMCRDEVYAFSQFDGYPAPDFEIPWTF